MDLLTGEGLDEPTEVNTPITPGAPTPTGAVRSILPWTEKYRGHDLNSIILPDEIRTTVENAIKFNSFGSYILYSGSPGTGKTSLARAIPEMLGTQSRFLYGKRDAEIIDEIEEYKIGALVNGKPRFVIIDEVDKARTPKEFFKNLQSTIESAEASTLRFILTCNNIHAIPEAVKSRCYPIEFKVKGDDANYKNLIYRHLKDIAEKETAEVGGTYDKNTLISIVRQCYPDIRSMIATMHHCFLMNGGSIIGQPPVITNDSIKEIFEMCKTYQTKALRYYLSINISSCNDVYVPLINYCIEHLPEPTLIHFGKIAGTAYDRTQGQLDPEIMLWCFCMEIMDLIMAASNQGLECV